MPLKKIFKSKIFGQIASWIFATSLRLAYGMSSKVFEPSDLKTNRDLSKPVIFVSWHGHSYLFPYMFKRGTAPTLMVARHGDGRLAGNAMAMLGMPLVFGSGSNDKSDKAATARKGGAVAFLQLLKLLRAGKSVKMTGDVPKVARVAGEGVILLARKSGCPLVPVAISSSRRRYVSSWDKMQISMPLSRIAFIEGAPIEVPDDDTPLQEYQTLLEKRLEALNARAMDLADGKATPQ